MENKIVSIILFSCFTHCMRSNNLKIIVLTGLSNAGKSSISTPTSVKYDIPALETGVFVYKAVEEKGLPVTGENIKAVSIEAKKISDSFFTEKLIAFAREKYSDKPALFVSGVRAYSEVEYLKNEFGSQNVLVIGFHASQDTRFKRINNPDRVIQGAAKAQEDAALKNFDNFLAREKKELDFGIGTIFAMADHILSNDDKKYPFYDLDHNKFVFEGIVRSFIDS